MMIEVSKKVYNRILKIGITSPRAVGGETNLLNGKAPAECGALGRIRVKVWHPDSRRRAADKAGCLA